MTQIENSPSPVKTGGGRVPPSAIEAEESLLGAMLLNFEAIAVGLESVSAEDFYRPLHGQIFSAISALASVSEPVDYITVQAKLKEMGAVNVEASVLSSLQLNTPSVSNAKHYADLVREKAQQRRLISVASEIVDLAYTPTEDVPGLIDMSEAKINAISNSRATDTVSPIHTLLLREAEILEERGETRGQFNGVETGYRSLDLILQGLQPHSLTIVGARPGMGKTAFGLGVLIHVGAVVNRPALYFSLEMSRQELAERILASTARIDSQRLRSGDLTDADWNRTHDAFGFLNSARIFIDDNPGLTVMDVRARARRIKAQEGDLGVIIVDYLQLMSSRGRSESRQIEVSEMSRSLKILARELQTPVIALSQLSRKSEDRQEKRPMISDLRESGSLEQDADVILMLFRPDAHGEVTNDQKADAEVIVGKNRSGPMGTAHLTWRGQFARFENVADSREI